MFLAKVLLVFNRPTVGAHSKPFSSTADSKTSQRHKMGKRSRRRTGRGALNLRIASFAGNSERQSFMRCTVKNASTISCAVVIGTHLRLVRTPRLYRSSATSHDHRHNRRQ
ncbi:hypothetical protein EVAR_11997_1 [Eumeta japonica]|uniref:Uncharacterized protein n=1 Tax=Eumeta variegata TaxID=151549 RepID=A0A4C1U6D6_EUMVA|nr:hypothetical protein EVAR_11997_1 [Eumeta japonica]